MFNRPTQPKFSRVKAHDNKCKLIAMLLRRFTDRALKQYFDSIKAHSNNYVVRLKRMERIYDAKAHVSLRVAWSKIRMNSFHDKSRERMMRDCLVLSKRIQTSFLRESFNRLHLHMRGYNTEALERVMASRTSIMLQVLRKIINGRKKAAWFRLQTNVHAHKLNKRLLIVNFIAKNTQRRLKLQAFNRLKIFSDGTAYSKGGKQIENLELQLQDLKIQVENKNCNIGRLQEQIMELKQCSVYKPPESSSFIYYSNNTKSCSGLQKNKGKFNSSFDKDSHENSLAKDPSFGSLLGGSFVSYRSRKSQSRANENDSNASKNECQCSFKQKYEKYKANNETLKKQLQIIKTELQFTKDMNEHMENEIRSHMGNNEKDQKIEKLRQDLKDSHRQKQALKEKILKYEKYVSKLKIEFKTKIEEIYRRVKKSN